MRVVFLVVVLLLMAGCSGGHFPWQSGQSSIPVERQQYFQGTQGVEMAVDQFPPRLYFYGNAPNSVVNEFPFGVEVWNIGASYSRGGLFVSGYDPNLIQIDEINIPTSFNQGCALRFGDYSLNRFGLIANCGNNFRFRGDSQNWFRAITVRGTDWFGIDELEGFGVDFEHFNDGSVKIDFLIDNYTLPFQARSNGILLIGLLSGVSFEAYLGQEYLLAGDSYDYPGGELDYIPFTGRILNWPDGADEIPQTFMFTNCYMYTTYAAPVVCIDPQPYVENRKVCQPQRHTWRNSQGAPVAITNVVQENTPRKAVFHIDITNVGTGQVYDPGSLEKCSPYYPGGARANDLDQVWLGDIRIGLQPLQCTPERVVKLRNGRGRVTCTYNIEFAEINTAYETPMVIELWYGYQQVLERRVPVKRVT